MMNFEPRHIPMFDDDPDDDDSVPDDLAEEIRNHFKFMMARNEAESRGDETFTCPICGSEAWQARAASNGHLHCGCDGCGIRVIH